MAKKQTFADKMHAVTHTDECPVCNTTMHYIKHVKAIKQDNGAWKFRTQNTGVCKCNEKEIYA